MPSLRRSTKARSNASKRKAAREVRSYKAKRTKRAKRTIPTLQMPDVHITSRSGDLTVMAFGDGTFQQLGLGEDILESSFPKPVNDLSNVNVLSISSGPMHNAVVLGDGSVVSWGTNDDGALGRITEEDEAPPGVIEFPITTIKIAEIACGNCHSIVRTVEGTIYTWGCYKNDDGYLGYNTTIEKQQTPKLVYFDKPAISIAAGENFDLAVLNNGSVWEWGDCKPIIHSTRRTTLRRMLEPQRIRLNTTLSGNKPCRVFAALATSFILTNMGQVFAWGLTAVGQTGLTDLDESTKWLYTPKHVEALDDLKVTKISGGMRHAVALTSAGTVYGWGMNEYYQLGLPRDDDAKIWPPTLLEALGSDCVDVCCGANHTLVAKRLGRPYGFGFGENGICGNGTDEEQEVPAPIQGKRLRSRNAVMVSGAHNHSVLVMSAEVERPTPMRSEDVKEGGEVLRDRSVILTEAAPDTFADDTNYQSPSVMQNRT